MYVIGQMTGTSVDGVDVGLFEITGAPPKLFVKQVEAIAKPFENSFRQRILTQCDPQASSVTEISKLNVDLGEHNAAVMLELLDKSGIDANEVGLIGLHGQTLWHEVRADGSVHATYQIAEASVVAERTGITTISNFRARDIAAGGQGAPLTGYVDWLLLRHPTKWRAIQNIGGMGNVTFVPPLSEVAKPMIAFDTGPGNVLIDMAISYITHDEQHYDNNGEMARSGNVDSGWVEEFIDQPYFHRPPPKTTGREFFSTGMAQELVNVGRERGLSDKDIIATITGITAVSIADSYMQHAPAKIDEIIVGGGGRHNQTLLEGIAKLLEPVTVLTHEDIGISSDFKEALVFAVLAYETWHNRIGNLPSQTGASHPVVLGQITPGENYRQLLQETWG